MIAFLKINKFMFMFCVSASVKRYHVVIKTSDVISMSLHVVKY